MRAPRKVQHTLNQPGFFCSLIMNDSKNFMLSTFRGGKALKEESTWRLWNLIIDTTAEPIDELSRNTITARYTLTNHMLISNTKKCEIRVNFAWRRAALYVWLEIFCILMYLHSSEEKYLYLLVTGGHHLQ